MAKLGVLESVVFLLQSLQLLWLSKDHDGSLQGEIFPGVHQLILLWYAVILKPGVSPGKVLKLSILCTCVCVCVCLLLSV